MSKTFESIGLSDEQFAEKLSASYEYLLNKEGYAVQNYPVNLPPFEDHEVSGYNLVSENIRIRGYFNSGRTTATGHSTYASGVINTFRSFAKVERAVGGDPVYPCLVRYELNYKFRTDESYTGDNKDTIMLFMCNRADGLNITTFPYADDVYHYQCNPTWYDNIWDTYTDRYLNTRGDRYTYSGFSTLGDTVTKLKQIYPFTDDYSAHLEALNNATNIAYVMNVNNPSRDQKFICGVPCAYMDTSGYHYTSRIKEIPDWLPCFDGKDVSAIINYLRTGDSSGGYDPFDPNTPIKEKVEDFATNYKVFVTRDNVDKTKTHFSVVAYNNDYIQMGDRGGGLYGMWVYVKDMRTQWSSYVTEKLGNATQSMYPTMGFIGSVGYSKVIGMRFHDMIDQSLTDYQVEIGFEYKEDSAVNCKVVGANVMGVPMTKSAIVDGYRYTSSDGRHTVDVLYRAVGIDDLDDGFPNPEDNENDKSGTDSSFIVGNGLNTFAITNAQFGTINKKLWSTDWTQVLKSNSIDPIRCVISCKGIPFTATPSAMSHVVIANMDTGVDANTCNPVKSFDCGSVLMPSFRGDFTDITMTKVHAYLPYIGWVELPGSEVMSRVAHAEVGISANPKRVGFKYLVDFVDGTCRCIVSVNRTERWYFDGHCDVDIPVTSDNHTNAIGNAIRSGVGAVLSVASAVGGAIAENPMMIATGITGAISNGANTIPTYSYSASASPSGYINASMNTDIMIVIEHPNMVVGASYNRKYGRPCGLTVNLGSLRGYTKCANVDTSGINGTETELSMIKSMLESGVYL